MQETHRGITRIAPVDCFRGRISPAREILLTTARVRRRRILGRRRNRRRIG